MLVALKRTVETSLLYQQRFFLQADNPNSLSCPTVFLSAVISQYGFVRSYIFVKARESQFVPLRLDNFP